MATRLTVKIPYIARHEDRGQVWWKIELEMPVLESDKKKKHEDPYIETIHAHDYEFPAKKKRGIWKTI